MGTSKSRPDPSPGRQLVPSHANADPAPAGSPVDQQQPLSPAPGSPPAAPPPPPPQPAPPRRYAGFRSALGRFAATGGTGAARQALGHWARTSVGGSSAGTARVARATRTGGAALAGLARAINDLPPVPGALDVRSLAGLPVETAIDRIVDAFCPPGILDEDVARLAIGEALHSTLAGPDDFDPSRIDARAVQVATLAFVAELVFLEIVGVAGESLTKAPSPAAAVERERELRDVVREVADVVGTPLLGTSGSLTPEQMSAVVARIVSAVIAEMETWEPSSH